jgi:hypothetical protein
LTEEFHLIAVEADGRCKINPFDTDEYTASPITPPSPRLHPASAPMTERAAGGVFAALKAQRAAGFVGARVRRSRRRRSGQLAELLASGKSVESGPFLVHLNGKICCAKSDRCGHGDRKKHISDFVPKIVSHGPILLRRFSARGSAATVMSGPHVSAI